MMGIVFFLFFFNQILSSFRLKPTTLSLTNSWIFPLRRLETQMNKKVKNVGFFGKKVTAVIFCVCVFFFKQTHSAYMLFYKRVELEEENGKDFSFHVSPDLLEVCL